ncbi:MAG: nitroreductase family protein [Anaerovoracaceae bacterium]|jgi:nitroreductase
MNKGDIMSSIYHRISVRKFENRPVEREKILEILRAGMQAPSAANQQPWEFYVVEDRKKIEELAAISQYSICAAGAPVVIVPVYRTETMLPEFAQIDLSIAQENIWLRTDELGLGGVWLAIAPREDRMRKAREILSLPSNLEVFSLFPLGYPVKMRPQEDRFHEDRIHWVK